MTGSDLTALAQEIYQKAIDSDLEDRGIGKANGRYYDSSIDAETLQYIVDDAVSTFSDVPAIFDDFLTLPEPGDFDGLIDSVESAMGVLSSGQEGIQDPLTGRLFPFNVELKDMTTAAGYLDEWDGLAAMEFIENFATPFPERCINQFAAASVLANALRAEQAIWTETKKNIDQIAQDTLAALDHMHHSGKNEWETAFSVAGAVVAIGAVTAASGGTAAIGLAIAGAAASVGGDVAGQMPETPEGKYSGDSAREVVESCRKAVGDLKNYVKEAEDKVKNACSQANSTVAAGGGENYVAPKPTILDQNRPDVGQPDND